MGRLPTVCMAVVMVLLAAGTAAAQRGPMGPMGGQGMAPEFRGVLNPVVGSGAVYQLEARGTKSEMEIAVVGKEDVAGKPGYWRKLA